MPHTASRSAKRKSRWPRNSMAGRKTRSFWCRMACWSTFRKALASAARFAREMERSCLPGTDRRMRTWPVRLTCMQRRELPSGWDKNLPTFPADAKGMGTRESSGKVLNALAQNIPWLIGGAADLATSNKTDLKFEGAGTFEADNYGGPQLSLRRARARYGGSAQWHGGFEVSGPLAELSLTSATICGPASVWRR